AADAEAPLPGIDRRNIHVRADKEMFDRREVVRKAGERHFEILGANGAGNHVALGTILASKNGSACQENEIAAAHVYFEVVPQSQAGQPLSRTILQRPFPSRFQTELKVP